MEAVMLAQQELRALEVHTSYLLPKAGIRTQTPPTLCSAQCKGVPRRPSDPTQMQRGKLSVASESGYSIPKLHSDCGKLCTLALIMLTCHAFIAWPKLDVNNCKHG